MTTHLKSWLLPLPTVLGCVLLASPCSSAVAQKANTSDLMFFRSTTRNGTVHSKLYTVTVRAGKAVGKERQLPVSPYTSSASISKNGRVVFAVGDADSDRSDIYTLRVGATPRRLTASKTVAYSSPSFSPNGRKIVFVAQRFSNYSEARGLRNTEIGVMDSSGRRRRILTFNPVAKGQVEDSLPSFSPDGRKIAFVRRTEFDVNAHICLMNVDGSGLRVLTVGNRFAWSPTGSDMAVTRYFQQTSQIWLLNMKRRKVRRFSPEQAWSDGEPVFSPDGRRIAFTASRYHSNPSQRTIPLLSELFVASSTGQNRRRLTSGASDLDPMWSMDGRHIVFVRRRVTTTGGINHAVYATSLRGVITKLVAENEQEKSLVGWK